MNAEENKEMEQTPEKPVHLLQPGTLVKIGGWPLRLLNEVKVEGYLNEEFLHNQENPEDLVSGEIN